MLAEFAPLHLRVLAFVGRGYAGIEGCSHGFAFRGRPPSLPFAAEDFAFFFDVRLPSSRIASEMSFFLFTTGAFLTYPLGCVQRNRNGPARKCKTRNDSLSSLRIERAGNFWRTRLERLVLVCVIAESHLRGMTETFWNEQGG